MKLATAVETAYRNTRELQHGNPSAAHEQLEEQPVNSVTNDPPKPPKQPPRDPKKPNAKRECFRCKGQFHEADKCRYKDEECYKFRRNRQPGRRNGRKSGNTHQMET